MLVHQRVVKHKTSEILRSWWGVNVGRTPLKKTTVLLQVILVSFGTVSERLNILNSDPP